MHIGLVAKLEQARRILANNSTKTGVIEIAFSALFGALGTNMIHMNMRRL